MRRLAAVLPLLAACAAPGAGNDTDAVRAGELVVARYRRAPHDPAHHADTCKVWHDVYAPDGRLLTKGLGGEYDHHRGLFLGWNQVREGGRTWDFWHCRRGERQEHVGFAAPSSLALPGDGWQVAEIAWRTGDDRELLHERRALRARRLDATTTALDVVVELVAATAVDLDGDPQHAGHQFRALQQFAERGAAPVRYRRPASATGAADDVWRDCAWTAAELPLADGPVTVLRIEGADNRGPAVWSTRAYGRFGAMQRVRLAAGEPLRLRWCYVIATGSLDAARCAALAAANTPR